MGIIIHITAGGEKRTEFFSDDRIRIGSDAGSDLQIHTPNLNGRGMWLDLENADGEVIDAWMVFDASYSLSFGDDNWKTKVTLGCINLLGTDPPAVESPLGYEIGVHDARGRVLYARVTGEF